MKVRIDKRTRGDSTYFYPQKKTFLWGWVDFMKGTPLGKFIPRCFKTYEEAEKWLSQQK